MKLKLNKKEMTPGLKSPKRSAPASPPEMSSARAQCEGGLVSQVRRLSSGGRESLGRRGL